MILKTIDNPKISKINQQTHQINMPVLCPKTENPIVGSTVTIQYQPKQKLLEFYSINEYIQSFIGSQEVRDLELLTQIIARDCRAALGVSVTVTGNYKLNIGQTVICESIAR